MSETMELILCFRVPEQIYIGYLGYVSLAFGSNERETTLKHFHNYFCIPFSMNTPFEYSEAQYLDFCPKTLVPQNTFI